VEFPESRDAPVSGGNRHPAAKIPVPSPRRACSRPAFQLGPGSVLTLDKSVEAPAELFLKDSKFAEAEVVVVDHRFAVRITQIVKAGAAGSPA
jgi:hypothetical protein